MSYHQDHDRGLILRCVELWWEWLFEFLLESVTQNATFHLQCLGEASLELTLMMLSVLSEEME